MKHTGLGFTLIKKAVFEAVQENTHGDPIWFSTDRSERNSFEVEVEEFISSKKSGLGKNLSDEYITSLIREAIIMGQQSHIGTLITGEDIGLCAKAKRLGFDSWIHCGVPVGHIGSTTFDMREDLPGCPSGIPDGQIDKPKLSIVGV